jgi:hypothetical protein
MPTYANMAVQKSFITVSRGSLRKREREAAKGRRN